MIRLAPLDNIDEQEFRTHHKNHLESDIQVSVKDEEMEEESIDAPLKCTTCKKLFVQFQDFRNHVWAHTEETRFPMNYDELEEESIDTPLKCTICKKLFVEKDDFRNHVWAHTAGKIWPLNLEESGFQYKSIPQQPIIQGRDLRQQKPRISRIRAISGATLNEAME